MKIKPRPHKCQELDVSLMNLTEVKNISRINFIKIIYSFLQDDPNQTANSIVSMLIDLVDEVETFSRI